MPAGRRARHGVLITPTQDGAEPMDHHPLMTVALESARQEDLMREARQLQRHRHLVATEEQLPDRTAAMSRRLIRSIPRGIGAALAPSRP